ncbi:hypothetical protein [Pseudomonas peli]|uniref:hypothetical protein n=1 Tax=Pseudomonas peli TaxID=592361 RepID=UPI0024ACEE4B|nr:hypothetical protein [Pseudomonas peli]
MKAKYLVAAAAMAMAMSAWAAPQDVYMCDGVIKDTSITPVIITPRCGENVPLHEYRMFNFVDSDGRPYVGRATVLARVQCSGGVCAVVYMGQYGEAAGTAPDGSYYVQRGYYLDRDSTGATVAYRMGMGPQYNGRVADPAPASNGLTGEACFDQKMAAFRQENGDEAMIIMDQINEWNEQCGLPPSQ